MSAFPLGRKTGEGKCCRHGMMGMVPFCLLPVLLAGCLASRPPQAASQASVDEPAVRIRIRGSDTMVPLVLHWSEAYMQRHPGVSIYVKGGGSRRGIESLILGSADLCSASRAMRADEIKHLHDRRRSLGMGILVAKDALSIYLHPDNPVRNLTMDQLRNILSGKVKNWSEVGGENRSIEVVNRQPNSGTYAFLKEHVLLAEPYIRGARAMPNTAAVIRAVNTNPAAIGYGGIAYGNELIHCSLDGFAPTGDNVVNGTYPLARYLYLYSVTTPNGHLKGFIDFILSDEGQGIVEDVGYIPLWQGSTQAYQP